jgi:HEAT repeat protein
MTLLGDNRASAATKSHAAEALGMIGAAEAIDLLMRALSDQSPDVRYSSVYALAALQATAARESIRRLAESDSGVTDGGFRVADEARRALDQLKK